MSRKRLKTLEDVRRYLAGLINRLEGGLIDPQVAGKLGYLAQILKGCIEASDIEKRLTNVEAKVGD